MQFFVRFITTVGFILSDFWSFLETEFTGLKNLCNKQNFFSVSVIFLVLILISKELIIFNEEILVFVSFVSFIYFTFTELNNLIYLELVSRNEKIYREADLNLFYHQQIINSILELYKVASYIQNKLKNEYIFFRQVFFFNLWPCKAINYINSNIVNIEKNFNIIYNEQYNMYQELQTNKTVFDYELLKNLSISYMYN